MELQTPQTSTVPPPPSEEEPVQSLLQSVHVDPDPPYIVISLHKFRQAAVPHETKQLPEHPSKQTALQFVKQFSPHRELIFAPKPSHVPKQNPAHAPKQ